MSALEKTKMAPDLTCVLDPAELWPDAETCPDWPLADANQSFIRSRAAAEAQLQTIGAHLNRGPGGVYEPTKAERDEIVSRFFKHGQPRPHWQALGITNLCPAGPIAESTATMIVQAAHIRGYLRKLDVRAKRDEDAKAATARASLVHDVESYPETLNGLQRQLKDVSEGAARHEQRIADEKAFYRARELRTSIQDAYGRASRAATELGQEVPPAPVVHSPRE